MAHKILVLGASGMLGASCFRFFLSRQYNIFGTIRSSLNRGYFSNIENQSLYDQVDAYDFESIQNIVLKLQPDIILNCIGIIKQLDNINDSINTIYINSLLPHQLAKLADSIEAKLIHFSTDCVFTGVKGNYVESDFADSNDLYGRSKFLGEVNNNNHLTLRTSIIGHELNSHFSLIDWFLHQQDTIQGYSKAIFSGLPTCYVAEIVENIILNHYDLSGLFHLSVDPINKYDLLNIVKNIYQKNIEIVKNENFIIDRSLDSTKLNGIINYPHPSWELLIKKLHQEYLTYH
ncbi:NAD(P)-dependent oxidoreductase [Wohlfahrtiimonas chitiniclastica]|uniref:dTDP-4-dehydrorhamnose reductase family protein n=1 Tax=Wohlfahrtiimonas chitiniclastica TaxID=400946 RepID=UPI000B98F985|nr:SDR family oxidoreductase [Wohlfahrtiimonas chitiniclastica]OYQ77610.1 NAD(P)-dependent oxidoreductase [Wohlfahrtiimonas chitiniclastica]